MKFDPESALHLLLEQALKNVTLDGYASFLATFFVQFMPVASLAVREFDTNHITQLAHYAVNKTVFSPPRVVTIPDALVYELYLDPDCSGDKYKASILSSKDGTSRTRVFTMLHMAEETSIFFPLLVDDRFLHCFYISISAIGKNKYGRHLQICESSHPFGERPRFFGRGEVIAAFRVPASCRRANVQWSRGPLP
ncbi:MAG: hypothetical protein ACLSHC_14650 [Bilophila wadsworthia]